MDKKKTDMNSFWQSSIFMLDAYFMCSRVWVYDLQHWWYIINQHYIFNGLLQNVKT